MSSKKLINECIQTSDYYLNIFFTIIPKAKTPLSKGRDISWLTQMEVTGYKFYNDKAIEQDCFKNSERPWYEYHAVADVGKSK